MSFSYRHSQLINQLKTLSLLSARLSTSRRSRIVKLTNYCINIFDLWYENINNIVCIFSDRLIKYTESSDTARVVDVLSKYEALFIPRQENENKRKNIKRKIREKITFFIKASGDILPTCLSIKRVIWSETT